MRTPIAYGLAWPERIDAGVAPLDLISSGRLDFLPPDETRFPALRLAREVFVSGGNSAVIMNAANEVAVAAFLERQLSFTRIVEVAESTVYKIAGMAMETADTIETLITVDQLARRYAYEEVVKSV